MARNGIVTTSQPLAAEAGLKILREGGNAIDAAVAAAATLNVVEPMSVGMGGDLFAIIYIAKEHKIHVLNASGKAPSGLTLALMNSNGYRWNPRNWGPGSGMPMFGILPVTVPGATWGWQEVLDKYGTMQFKQVLQPAIDYATQGFAVSERISQLWVLRRRRKTLRATRCRIAARRSIRTRSTPGTSAVHRQRQGRSSATRIWRSLSNCCRSKDAALSIPVQSPRPSLPNPGSWVAP